MAGGLFLALFGNRLLPERQSMGVLLNDRRKMKFFTEVAVPEDSTLIGQAVQDVDIFKREGVRVIDVLRGDASLRRDLTGVTLAGGDRAVLRTEMAELMGLQRCASGRQAVQRQDRDGRSAIGPGCRMRASGWATCGCAGAMVSMCWQCIGEPEHRASWTT